MSIRSKPWIKAEQGQLNSKEEEMSKLRVVIVTDSTFLEMATKER